MSRPSDVSDIVGKAAKKLEELPAKFDEFGM
jgi:hypothetical protein